jgi:beta-lactamase superfamily II metal-dependent hydrolase
MLFTSNIQTGARDKLLNEQLDKLTNATVMTAPYYGLGSGTSNIQLFLTKTKPNEIVICGSSDDSEAQGGSRSAFKNLLVLYNIPYTETYVNGTVRILYDGNSYVINAVP